MRFVHLLELAAVAGWVALMLGLFFLRVHAKTRESLHLVAALGSIGIFPFLAAGSGLLLHLMPPQALLSLQAAGLTTVFLFHVFCQHFHRFMPRTTWVLGGIHVALGVALGAVSLWPSPDLFQALRRVMLLANLAAGAGALVLLGRGMQRKRPGAALLFVAMGAFVLACGHDALLALGAIQSVALMPGAVTAFVAAMLWVACGSLADALAQHKRLVKDLRGLNDHLEQLVAQRAGELRQKTQDMHGMLQNLTQGVLILTEGNRVHAEYSAHLETLLETRDIAGRHVTDLLFAGSRLAPEALAQVEAAASSCFGRDRTHFGFSTRLLVGELEKAMPDGRVKVLALGWSPICNAQDTVEKLMLCVRDVTELKRLEADADQRQRELALIGEILPVSQEKFRDFIEGAARLMDESRRLVEGAPDRRPEVVHHLFRHMHTIKGHARTYGLRHLARHVQAVEQDYDHLRRSGDDAWQPGRLLAQLAALRALLDDYARINDQVLGRKGPGRRGSVAKYLMVEKDQVEHSLQLLAGVDLADATAMRGAINQVALSLNLIGTDRLDDVLVGILDALPPLAVELGKEPPVVRIEDHGLVIRSQVHGLLKNVFTHLLRNAVDHGLEPAAERLARGKPVAGRIDLRLALVGGRLRISLRDDGRGIPIATLRRRAVAQKLLTPAQARSAHAVAQAIFLPGFSSAEQVTEVSGRGVGMAAVQEAVKKEQGEVEVRFLDTRESADHRTFELVITLAARYAVQPGAQPGRRPAMGASAAAS
jgi:signal transduction histidine kinase